MKISVVTPTLNSIATVHRAYASLNRNSVGIREWIVVDSGSTDGTVEFVNGCRPSFEVKLISIPPRGPYDAMNHGIMASKGEVISILNSDDAWTDGVNDSVLRFFLEFDADIVFGRIKYIALDGSYSMVGSDVLADLNTFRLNLVHPAVFVSRHCYEKIGLFNLSYPISADLEWLLKARLDHRLKFVYSDNLIVDYHCGGLSSRVREGIGSYIRIFVALRPPMKWLMYMLARYTYSIFTRFLRPR